MQLAGFLIVISKPTTVQQIDAWRRADETETLEFKEAKERFALRDILAYCVAIGNERGGILLLGISDKPPRSVVGTKAYPHIGALKKDLLDRLHFRVDIEAVEHPDGRVLVFHIPPRPTGHPYHLDGAYLMRSGEALVPMTTEQIKQITEEEMSPLAKQILYMVGGIIVVVVLLIVYVSTEHLWRTQSQSPDHKTVVEQAGSLKTPEQQPASKTPSSSISKSHKALIERVNWRDKRNWREYLHTGMTKTEVRKIFGDPERVSVSGTLETWDYGSGSIDFMVESGTPDGSLYSWFEPRD